MTAQTKKLLLADDSVVIQKLVGLSFANENVEIVYTDNGDDAVTRAREIQPDVVLADVVMPGKSGYEVCETLKQDPALAHVPVLLLTGTFEAFDEARAESAGADGQITKPFEAQALVSRVTDVMNNPPQKVAKPAPTAAVAQDAAEPERASFLDSIADSSPTAGAAATSGFAVSGSEAIASSTLIDDSEPSSATPLIKAEAIKAEAIKPEAIDFPFDATDISEQAEPTGLDLSPVPPVTRGTPLSTSDSVESSPKAPTASPTASAAEPPALPPNYLSPPPIESSEAAEPDPVAAMQRELTPGGADDGISAFELDEALAAGMPEGDATIFVAETPSDQDPNAMTIRNLATEPPSPSPLDELTQLAPSAPIDQDQAAAQPPNATFGRRSSDALEEAALNETIVTNLDERLASTSLAAGIASPKGSAEPTRETAKPSNAFGSFTDPGTSSRSLSGTPLKSPFGDEDVEPLDTTDSEMLDIGPVSQDGDDLSYGFDEALDRSSEFDVSEQQEVAPTDPLDQTFSSLMDVSESEILGSPLRPAPLLTDFDVSSGDLGAALPPSRSEAPAAQSADGRFGTPIAFGDDSAPKTDATETTDPAAGPPIGSSATAAAENQRTPDLSPMMEQRVQEALEKVAWEAFSDLSESIVKQVMTRVESIAWEVIPQMAETLVREEIRQMKGDDED